MSQESVNVMIDGQMQSLTDIADLDNLTMDEVEENTGGDTTPAGVYQFAVRKAERSTTERTINGTKVTVPMYKFEFEAVNVLALTDPNLELASQVGRKHFESIAIVDLKKDLGRVKALMERGGYATAGIAMVDLMLGFVGHEFVALVKNRKSKDDADVVYANIDLKKIKPVSV